MIFMERFARVSASFVVVASLIGVLCHVRSGFAWSVDTHQVLSEEAAKASQLSAKVLSGLGFQNLNTQISGAGGADFNRDPITQSIARWIRDGAAFEDSGSILQGTARYFNHFHNPLHQRGALFKPWRNAGLDDYVLGVFHVHGESSVLWAQNQGTNDLDTMTNPVWSWQGVREAYYQAFTAQVKADRDASFARVFAGLGHVIHLIQDMAQPEITRYGFCLPKMVIVTATVRSGKC